MVDTFIRIDCNQGIAILNINLIQLKIHCQQRRKHTLKIIICIDILIKFKFNAFQ